LPESDEEAEKRRLRELEGKNIQHYSVLLAAWIETRMERDRTLVALSAAAIGLLVTILTAVGLPRLWMVLLYVGAFAGFLLTIWTAIRIYQLNSEKLSSVAEKPPTTSRSISSPTTASPWQAFSLAPCSRSRSESRQLLFRSAANKRRCLCLPRTERSRILAKREVFRESSTFAPKPRRLSSPPHRRRHRRSLRLPPRRLQELREGLRSAV